MSEETSQTVFRTEWPILLLSRDKLDVIKVIKFESKEMAEQAVKKIVDNYRVPSELVALTLF